jgi:hypothetical protein
MTLAVRDAPSESVTLAVIVCVPFESSRVKAPPPPIDPSMLEDH